MLELTILIVLLFKVKNVYNYRTNLDVLIRTITAYYKAREESVWLYFSEACMHLHLASY